MTDTVAPTRRKTSPKPDAPEVAPEGAPDRTPHPAPRPKDAPRTMKDLRLARQGKRKAGPRQDDNPLREGLRLERVPDPSVLVLFGATGDLAHRKVIPALYHLWRTNLLPHDFVVLAVGRRDYDEGKLREEFRASLEQYSRVLPLDEAAWRSFADRIRYQKLDFANPADFDGLVTVLDGIDREQSSQGNHLYYLATQPSAFADIVAQLGRVGLDHERHEGGWRRIVIEKPFGHDLVSAIRLNREVGKVFRESQVYRIDHYLGKETVRNLLVFRFGNGIFEPIWNRRHIDHVQITVAESIGVENRGAFYEETGASRDFLQNHLLQLMSLVAMEPPATFDADALRDEKVKVIRAIGELTPSPGTATSRRSTRSRRPSRTSRPGSRSTTGAGQASRSTSARASGCRSGRPRSRSSSRKSRIASSAIPGATPTRTSSPSESSPTKGSCSASARKFPASASTSDR
jgi:hypothetical protein